MQPQRVEAKPKSKVVAYEISCEECNLVQIYRAKSTMRCIHCLTPLNLSKLKPKYQ